MIQHYEATRVARNKHEKPKHPLSFKQQNPQLKNIHKNTSAGQPKQQTPSSSSLSLRQPLKKTQKNGTCHVKKGA